MENTRKCDGTFVNGILLIILTADVCEGWFLVGQHADVSSVPTPSALCEASEADGSIPIC